MQTKPDFLDELIQLASKKAGSDYKLAAMLEVGRQAVSDWKKGRKPCPAGDVALMAEIAGLDPEAWAARAVIAQYAGTPKGDKIAHALGKALLVTGAALGSFSASATTRATEALTYFIQCILC